MFKKLFKMFLLKKLFDRVNRSKPTSEGRTSDRIGDAYSSRSTIEY